MADNSFLYQGFNGGATGATPMQGGLYDPKPAAPSRGGLLNRVGGIGAGIAKGLWQATMIPYAAKGIGTDLAANSKDRTVRDYAIQQQHGSDYSLKSMAGHELQLASLLVPMAKGGQVAAAFGPGAGMGTRIAANAGVGATFGAGNAMAENANTGDIAKQALIGGAFGGAIGGGTGILNKVVARRLPAAAADVADEAGTSGGQVAAATPKVVAYTGRGAKPIEPIHVPAAASATPNLDKVLPTHNLTASAAPATEATQTAGQKVVGASQNFIPTPSGAPSTGGGPAQADDSLIKNYINNLHAQQGTPSPFNVGTAAQAPSAAGATEGAGDSLIKNYLNNLAQSRGESQPFSIPAGAGQKDLPGLFGELQQKTDQLLQGGPKTATPAATVAKTAVVQPAAGASQRIAAALSPEEAGAKAGLPKGYNITEKGDVISPSGRSLNIQEAANLHQPQYLTDYEQARNAGDTATMQKIAAAHPGDAHVHLGATDQIKAPSRGNLLQRVGRAFKTSATGVRNLGGNLPYGATKETEIYQALQNEGLLKPGTNSEIMYGKLPGAFAKYQNQMNDVLSKTNASVPAEDLAAQVNGAIDKVNRITGGDSATDAIKTNMEKIIKKAANSDGTLSNADIYSLKQEIQAKLDNAYAKIDRGKGVLTNNEDTLMAVRNTLNNALPSQARSVGQKESALFDAAQALNKARHMGYRPGTILGTSLPIKGKFESLGHAAQSIGTAVGAPIEAAGNVLENAGKIAEPVLHVAGEVLSNPTLQAAAPVIGAAGAVNAPQAPTSPEDNAAPATQVPNAPGAYQSQDQLNQAIMGAGGNGGPQPIPGFQLGQNGMGPYHSLQELQAAAQRYSANPSAPEFNGVDPMIFGYSADNTGQAGGMQTGQNVQFNPQTGKLEPVQSAENTAGGPSNGGLTSEMVGRAMQEDLMVNNGANLGHLSTIYQLLKGQEAEQQKQNQPQAISQAATDHVNSVQRAQMGLQAINEAFANTHGTGEGLLSKVLAGPVGSVTGTGHNVQNVNRQIQLYLPDIAKAMGYGTSAAELKSIAQMLPNTSDTQKSAQAKLNIINGQINTYLSQYLNNQSNYAQPTNQTLDALAQVSSGGQQFNPMGAASYGQSY